MACTKTTRQNIRWRREWSDYEKSGFPLEQESSHPCCCLYHSRSTQDLTLSGDEENHLDLSRCPVTCRDALPRPKPAARGNPIGKNRSPDRRHARPFGHSSRGAEQVGPLPSSCKPQGGGCCV